MSSDPISAYPLSWPVGWKRTDSYRRKDANFKRDGDRLTVFAGLNQNESNAAVQEIYRRVRGRGTDAEQAMVNVAWDQFKEERGIS